MRPDFDLQSHSTCSDGALAPEEVVARPACGCFTVVSGVEISTVDDAGPDLHLLGYTFDPADRGLEEALARFRADLSARIARMTDAAWRWGRTRTATGLLTTGSTDFHAPEHPFFPNFLGFSRYGHPPRLGRISGASPST